MGADAPWSVRVGNLRTPRSLKTRFVTGSGLSLVKPDSKPDTFDVHPSRSMIISFSFARLATAMSLNISTISWFAERVLRIWNARRLPTGPKPRTWNRMSLEIRAELASTLSCKVTKTHCKLVAKEDEAITY